MKGEKHDAEACAAAIVGDITPNCGISKEKKAQLEADAIEDIQKLLGAESSVGTSSTAALQPNRIALHVLDLNTLMLQTASPRLIHCCLLLNSTGGT